MFSWKRLLLGFSSAALLIFSWSNLCKHAGGHSVTTTVAYISLAGCVVWWSGSSLELSALWKMHIVVLIPSCMRVTNDRCHKTPSPSLITSLETIVTEQNFQRMQQLRPHWWICTKIKHIGRGKMAAIFQTTSLNAFFWIKMNRFRLRFHLSLFLRVQLTIFHHWFR